MRWYHDATFAVGKGFVVRYQHPQRIETSENEENVEISIVTEPISDGSGPEGNGPSNAAATADDRESATAQQVQEDSSETNSSRRRPKLLTKAEQSQLIQDDVKSTTMLILEAEDAEATQFPVVQVRNSPLNVHDLLQLSASDFPSEYAYFVTTTSALVTPLRQEQLTFHVQRKDLLQVSIELLSIIPASSVRSSMRINFLNEQGVDAGGVYREWFMLLNEALVDPSAGIFTCVNPVEQTFFLNGNSEQVIGADHLLFFSATGRLVGRALFDGHALGFHLCLPLLKIILGQPVTLGDLEFFDPEVFRSLRWILENDVEPLALDFSVLRPIQDGDKSGFEIVDLIPNGRHCAVTEANKQQLVTRKLQYLLFESVADQLHMFLRGVYEVVPQDLLLLFDAEEFDYLLCGSDEIDVDDWERNTVHSIYLMGHPAKDWFWQIVREMPNEYRRRLLQFATGSSREPLAGFSALTSFDGKLCPFTLKAVPLVDEGYISSHACFNRLDLPLHAVRQELRTVLYAILDTELYGFTIALWVHLTWIYRDKI